MSRKLPSIHSHLHLLLTFHAFKMEDGLAARLAAIEETIAATNREERVDFFSDSDDSDF